MCNSKIPTKIFSNIEKEMPKCSTLKRREWMDFSLEWQKIGECLDVDAKQDENL